MRAISIYTALAAVVSLAGASSGFSEHGMDPDRYLCHANCGGVIQRTRENGCDDEELKGHREGCKKCALEFEIWQSYANGVKRAMAACGLPELVPDPKWPKKATSSATAAPQPKKQSGWQQLSARPSSEAMPFGVGKQPDKKPRVEGDNPDDNQLAVKPSKNQSQMVVDYPETEQPESKEPEKQSEKQSEKQQLSAGTPPGANRPETEQSESQPPAAGKESETKQSKEQPQAAGKQSDTNLSKEQPQAKESGTKQSDKQPQIKDQEAHQSESQPDRKESGTKASAKQSESMAPINATTTLALKPPASASSGSGSSGNVPQPISSAKFVHANGAGKIFDFATALAVAALAMLAVY